MRMKERARARQWLADTLSCYRAGRMDAAAVASATAAQVLDLLTQPDLDYAGTEEILVGGDAAHVVAPGVAVGAAHSVVSAGGYVDGMVLVCDQLNADALSSYDRIAGVLTAREDPSSHAAIVSRARGKVVLCGPFKCSDAGDFVIGATAVGAGTLVSVDGHRAQVVRGPVPECPPSFDEDVRQLLTVLSQVSPVSVHANADNATEVVTGADRGASAYEARIEHMLLQEKTLCTLRAALFAEGDERVVPVARLADRVRQETEAMLRASAPNRVEVRLLDPPVHEFAPPPGPGREAVAQLLGIPAAELADRLERSREVNPMSGFRGARLLIMRPDVVAAQVRGIAHAALDHARRTDEIPVVHITIPMVVDANEVTRLRYLIEGECADVGKSRGRGIGLRVGVMIETPRAALLAEEIAAVADYFSFGTNDLAAQTFAFSRGECGRYLGLYLAEGILSADPFVVLDRTVRNLITSTLEGVRRAKRPIEVGICGEQAAHPESLAFCIESGMHAVSVAPQFVPRTLLAAAKYAISHARDNRTILDQDSR